MMSNVKYDLDRIFMNALKKESKDKRNVLRSRGIRKAKQQAKLLKGN